MRLPEMCGCNSLSLANLSTDRPMEILLTPNFTFIMPYDPFSYPRFYTPSTKELKARHKKQIADGIKKDRFKYASR